MPIVLGLGGHFGMISLWKKDLSCFKRHILAIEKGAGEGEVETVLG